MGITRDIAEELRAMQERAEENECDDVESTEDEREERDPAEAFGNVAGKIAALEGSKRKVVGAVIAVLAVVLVVFTLATSGIAEGSSLTADSENGSTAAGASAEGAQANG